MSAPSDPDSTQQQLPDELRSLRERLAQLEQNNTHRADALFRDLLEAAPDAMIVINAQGQITLVNSQTEHLFAYPRVELVGQAIELLMPERFRSAHVQYRDGYLKNPRPRPMGAALQLFGRRKDGVEFPVEISLSPLQRDDGPFILSSVRDVSERRRAEDRLRKAEARYRTLIEEIPAVTFMASLDGEANELYVSPQIEALLGFTQREWLDDPVLWFRQLHPEDKQRWNDEFAPTCSDGVPFSSVYRFVARDGRVVWVRGEAKLFKDDSGRPLFLQGVAFDITESKVAEQQLREMTRTLEERVQERTQALARSNANLEQFGYVVAHDLRQPLRTMKSFTQKLAAHIGGQLDEKGLQYVERIVNGADRMRILIDDLLMFSRVGTQGKPFAPVEGNEVFAAAVAGLQAAIEESDAEVSAGHLPAIHGDETQLVQLLQNLIGNALKFRGDQPPRVRLETVAQGDFWLFTVTDNGIGIEQPYLKRIFGLGERLHGISQYPGNGIGLATCEKIVQRHGGRIWADSPGLDQGATIAFTLPAASRP